MSTAEPPDETGPPVRPSTPDPAPPPGPATGTPPTDTPADGPTTGPPIDAGSGATWSAASGTAPPAPPTPTAAAVPPAPPGPPTDTLVPSTDAWGAPPPTVKRRLTWLWILLGVLGLISALVVVAVVLFVRTLSGPIDATNKVLAQIKAGQAATVEARAQANYAKAYRLSCSRDRAVYTEQQYRQVFESTKAARGPVTSYDVNYGSVHGDRADVRYDLGFGRGGEKRYKAVVRKEGGTWRACLLTSGGGG